jgi:teichuronic acid biosynthesis glycosyltransferase TuaG
MPPLVSVITPAYNASRFLPDCLESVRQQTAPEWEHLIVDDGSTDGTPAIVESAAAHDERLRLILLPRNAGAAEARNAALQSARGRYLAFLDADDIWLSQKLELQIAFMRAREAAMSFTSYRVIAEDGRVTGPLIAVPASITYAQLLKRTAIALSTVVIDRETIGVPHLRSTGHEDYALWLELLRGGLTAHGLQRDLMRLRATSKSLSRNKLQSARWVWNIYVGCENLSTARAAWCFVHYGVHAVRKRWGSWY